MRVVKMLAVLVAVVVAATVLSPIADAQRGREERGRAERAERGEDRPGWDDVVPSREDVAPADGEPIDDKDPDGKDADGKELGGKDVNGPGLTDFAKLIEEAGPGCGAVPDVLPDPLAGGAVIPSVVVDGPKIMVDPKSQGGFVAQGVPVQEGAKDIDGAKMTIGGEEQGRPGDIGGESSTLVRRLTAVQLPVGELYRYRYVSITDQLSDMATVSSDSSSGFFGHDPSDPPPVTVAEIGTVDEAQITRSHMRVEAVADVVVLEDLVDDQGEFDGQWLQVTVQGACGVSWEESEEATTAPLESLLSADFPASAPSSENDVSSVYAGTFSVLRDRQGRVVEVRHQAATDPSVQMFRDGLASSLSVDVDAAFDDASVVESDRTTTQTSHYETTQSQPTSQTVLRTAEIPNEGLVRSAEFDLRAGGTVSSSLLRNNLSVNATKPGFFDWTSNEDGSLPEPHPATLPPGVEPGDSEVDGSVVEMDYYGSPIRGEVLNESHLWLEWVTTVAPVVVQDGLAEVATSTISNTLTPQAAQEQVRQINIGLAPGQFAEAMALMAAAELAGEQQQLHVLPTVLGLLTKSMAADEQLINNAATMVTSSTASLRQSEALIAAIATVDTPAAHTALESVLLSSANLPDSVEMTAIANTLILQSPPASIVNAVVGRSAGPQGDTANLVAAALAHDSGDAAIINQVESHLVSTLTDTERSLATTEALRVLDTTTSHAAATTHEQQAATTTAQGETEQSATAGDIIYEEELYTLEYDYDGGSTGGTGSSGTSGSTGNTGSSGSSGTTDLCPGSSQYTCLTEAQAECVQTLLTLSNFSSNPSVPGCNSFLYPSTIPLSDCESLGVVCTEQWQDDCVAQVTGAAADEGISIWDIVGGQSGGPVLEGLFGGNGPNLSEECEEFLDPTDPNDLCPSWSQYTCLTQTQADCVQTWLTLSNFTNNPSIPGCDSFLYPSTDGNPNAGQFDGTSVPEGAFQWEQTIGPDVMYGRMWVRTDPTDQSRLATYKAEAGAAIVTPTKTQPVIYAEAVMAMNTADDNAQNNITMGDMEIGQISRTVDFRAYFMGKPIFAKSYDWECGFGSQGQLFKPVVIGGVSGASSDQTPEWWPSLNASFPVFSGVQVNFEATVGVRLSGNWAWSIDACDFLITDTMGTAAGSVSVTGGIEVSASASLSQTAPPNTPRLVEAGILMNMTVFEISTPLKASAQLIYDDDNTRVWVEPCYSFELIPGGLYGTVSGFARFFDWEWSGHLFDFNLADILFPNSDPFEKIIVFQSECSAVAPVAPTITNSGGEGPSQEGGVFSNPVQDGLPLAVAAGEETWNSGYTDSHLEMTAAAFCISNGFTVPTTTPTTTADFGAIADAAEDDDNVVAPDNYTYVNVYNSSDPGSSNWATQPVSSTAERIVTLSCGPEADSSDLTITAEIDAGPNDTWVDLSSPLLAVGEEYDVRFTVARVDTTADLAIDQLLVNGTQLFGCEQQIPENQSSATLSCLLPLTPNSDDYSSMDLTLAVIVNGETSPSSETSVPYSVDAANAPPDIITTVSITNSGFDTVGATYAPGPVLDPNGSTTPDVNIGITTTRQLTDITVASPFNVPCTEVSATYWICEGPVPGLTAADANQHISFTATVDGQQNSYDWTVDWYAQDPTQTLSATVTIDGQYPSANPGFPILDAAADFVAAITAISNTDITAIDALIQITGGPTVTMQCPGQLSNTTACVANIATTALPTNQVVQGNIVATSTTNYGTQTTTTPFYIDNRDDVTATVEVTMAIAGLPDVTPVDALAAPGIRIHPDYPTQVTIDIEATSDLFSVQPTGIFADDLTCQTGGTSVGVAGATWQCTGEIEGLVASDADTPVVFTATSANGTVDIPFSWHATNGYGLYIDVNMVEDEPSTWVLPIIADGGATFAFTGTITSNVALTSPQVNVEIAPDGSTSFPWTGTPHTDDDMDCMFNPTFNSVSPAPFDTSFSCDLDIDAADLPQDQVVYAKLTVSESAPIGTGFIGIDYAEMDMRDTLPAPYDPQLDIIVWAQQTQDLFNWLASNPDPAQQYVPDVACGIIGECATFETTTILDANLNVVKHGTFTPAGNGFTLGDPEDKGLVLQLAPGVDANVTVNMLSGLSAANYESGLNTQLFATGDATLIYYNTIMALQGSGLTATQMQDLLTDILAMSAPVGPLRDLILNGNAGFIYQASYAAAIVGGHTIEDVRYGGTVYTALDVEYAQQLEVKLPWHGFNESVHALENMLAHEEVHVKQRNCAVTNFGQDSWVLTTASYDDYRSWYRTNIERSAYATGVSHPTWPTLSNGQQLFITETATLIGVNLFDSQFVIDPPPAPLLVLEADGNGGYLPIRNMTAIELEQWMRGTC